MYTHISYHFFLLVIERFWLLAKISHCLALQRHALLVGCVCTSFCKFHHHNHQHFFNLTLVYYVPVHCSIQEDDDDTVKIFCPILGKEYKCYWRNVQCLYDVFSAAACTHSFKFDFPLQKLTNFFATSTIVLYIVIHLVSLVCVETFIKKCVLLVYLKLSTFY